MKARSLWVTFALLTTAAVAWIGFAGSVGAQDTRTRAGRALRAEGTVQGCLVPNASGFVRLRERPSTEGVKLIDVLLVVRGLPDGKHAVHIHETGSCANTNPALPAGQSNCLGAGGHFDPGPNGNSQVDANHPHHSGDLLNIEVKDGIGLLRTTTSRVTLAAGPNSLFDANGSAIMIHTNVDTYCPQEGTAANPKLAGCAGGTRDACAILQLSSSDDDHDD